MREALATIMFDFVDACKATTTCKELFALICDASEKLGVEHFVFCGLPPAHENIDTHVVLDAWPAGWADHYAQQNYVAIDPIVKQIKQTGNIVNWSEALAQEPVSKRAQRLMDEARASGMAYGFTVPLYSRTYAQAVATFTRSQSPLAMEECTVLHMIAVYTHARLKDLHTFGANRKVTRFVELTTCESECVAWCAEGKTDWEIGQITNRSHRTVHHLIGSAQRKLDVVNRAQLIATVLRLGIQQ